DDQAPPELVRRPLARADPSRVRLVAATALGRDDAPEPGQGAAAGAQRPGGDELLEQELARSGEAAGEQVQEREPGRRCGHVERSPMTAGTRASAPAGQRSRCPCCTIAEPSCRRCLVSKLDTMPQEGAFMERPFAFRTTSLHPP